MNIKYDITAIGNALVDTQFKVSHELIDEVGLEIDQMNLSSAEEHAPIIDKLKKENAESVSDCGGSATNTLVAATHFGAKCFHTCVVADDEDGHGYLANLKNIGVNHNLKMRDADEVPTGKCLILVTADAKRTMSTALNVSALMQMDDIDYMVTSDENYSVTLELLKRASEKNIKIALSLSDPGVVMAFRNRFTELESFGADYIFCNDEEAIAFTSTESIDSALYDLSNKDFISIVTTGSSGCSIVNKDKLIQVKAESINAVDTNGAGDMFAGCFLYALSKGNSLNKCGKFANYGASKIVETFGPRLTESGYIEVLKKL